MQDKQMPPLKHDDASPKDMLRWLDEIEHLALVRRCKSFQQDGDRLIFSAPVRYTGQHGKR